MRPILLIDLDDTLFSNPFECFMPEYIKLLSVQLSPFIEPSRMVQQLLHATDRMIAKDLPEKTLEETFNDDFYPRLGLIKNTLSESINDFYELPYQGLKNLTGQRPEAIRIINFAKSRNFTIVVATNPLFPRQAILSRLEWAGFSKTDSPFSLITSYENMHFAKPNSAYYAEILGLLGYPHDPIFMVGNNLQDDILPACELGIQSFLVSDSQFPRLDPSIASVGSLEQVIPWLEDRSDSLFENGTKSIPAILAQLKSTPAVLETLTKNLSASDWRSKPSPSEWSVQESISHLLDVDQEIHLFRFEQIISNNSTLITGIDSDLWAVERNYNKNRTPQDFHNFLQIRTRLLELLSYLSTTEWSQKVRHSIFGPTTLQELAGFIASHDQDHIRQIFMLVSTF
ncbi:MAG: DinB family protein [Chloroflexi bacterium]|nr:DinB family protein [Chloroflexota bacterium]